MILIKQRWKLSLTFQVQVCSALSIIFIANLTATSALPEPEMSSGKPKVLIIGAGVSGIAAANKLMQNGISDVTILEAMERIGGRVNYQKIGEYGGVDLGGHWVHGQKGNIIYELAEPLGLVHSSGDYIQHKYFRSDGTELELGKHFIEMFDSLFEHLEKLTEDEKNGSFKDILNERVEVLGKINNISNSDISALQRHFQRNMCTLDSCADVSDLSLKTMTEYQEGEGDRLIEWKSGGMSNILALLMGTHEKSPWFGLGVDDKVKLSSRVAKIDYSGPESVKVATDSGSEYTADYVIFTPSLNILKKKHQALFNPPLPKDKVDAIQLLGMDAVDKVYLIFDKPWWPKEVTGFLLLHEKAFPTETQDWGEDVIAFSAENHNPHVLGMWLAGEGAKRMEADSDEKVKDTAMKILKRYVGKKFDIPEAKGMIRSRWWNNEDVGGSYSFNSKAAENLTRPRLALSRPLNNSADKPVMLFAGEATNPIHFSTVHGALETGWREADRIIEYIKQ